MDLEEIVFKIIGNAGDATGNFFSAINEAEKGNFCEAENLINEGNENLHKAHEVQTEMIREELNGKKCEMGILMVHAQDHLMNSILLKDLAKSIIRLHKKLQEK